MSLTSPQTAHECKITCHAQGNIEIRHVINVEDEFRRVYYSCAGETKPKCVKRLEDLNQIIVLSATIQRESDLDVA